MNSCSRKVMDFDTFAGGRYWTFSFCICVGQRSNFHQTQILSWRALATQTSRFSPTHKSHWSKILRWKTQRKIKKSNNDPLAMQAKLKSHLVDGLTSWTFAVP